MLPPAHQPQRNRLLPRKNGVFPRFTPLFVVPALAGNWLGRFLLIRPIPPKGRTTSGLPVLISRWALAPVGTHFSRFYLFP